MTEQRRKAILHVGTMKTGTSSIQAMLSLNREWLAERGYGYTPGTQRSVKEVALRIDQLKPGQNLILSDEGLWHFARSPRSETDQIAELLRDFDVTVLVYLRRPDQFQESWFIQGLKNGKGTPSVHAFRKSAFVQAGSNILQRLQIFVKLFGKDSIRLAPYERAQMAGGDAVIDFLARVGLADRDDNQETLAQKGMKWATEKNVTPDTDTMLLVSLLRHFGQTSEAELKSLMESAPLRTGKKTQVFRASECEAINARYRPMFAKVQSSYGGGASADFFLDWEVRKNTATSTLRPIYDRVIAQLASQGKPTSIAATASVQQSPPLRVAFVIQKLVGLKGGAERVFIETAEAMAARGMAVRLICLDPDPTVPLGFGRGILPVTSILPQWLKGRGKAAQKQNAKPEDGRPAGRSLAESLGQGIPNVFPLSHLKWHLTHGMFARALMRDLQRTPADVIVAFLPPAITAAAQAGETLGIPVVASTHNVPEQDFGDSPRWDQNPVYRARARKALTTATRVTVLQPEFQKWFGASVLPKIAVLPNPVSRLCEEAAPKPNREATILGVGRLTAIKRWDLLIEAFALIADDLPDWKLRIFGAGPQDGPLQARITALGLNSRINILPPTDRIGEEYDRAGMLVHPSEFEGFGLSVAEAMAHGLPAIAFSDCPGVNKLVQDKISGFLVNRTQDAQAAARNLADAIAGLAHSSDYRTDMGAAASEITQRFNRGEIHDKWAKLLRDAVAAQPDLSESA